METFFLLMVVVFLPFGWFILRMLRFTNETVGEDSPLHKKRTYQFSASQYFGGFTKLLLAFLLIEMVVGIFLLIRADIQPEFFLLLMVIFFSACASYLVFFFYFDWQYWLITRSVLITFNPLTSNITVDSPTQYCVLTSSNVIRIEEHTKDPKRVSRMLSGYGYYLFYMADGQIIRINNIFLRGFIYTEFLKRFFPNTPQTVIWHQSTWTTDLHRPENLKPPNFAA